MRKIFFILFMVLIFSLKGWVSPRDSLTAPLVSVISPKGSQPCTANPRTMMIQVSTDNNAICKFDSTDQAYDLMANKFSLTGETLHSSVVTSLSCNTSQTYFVRCADGSGDKNISSTPIQISISSSPPAALEKSGRYLKYNGQYKWLVGVDNQTLFVDRNDNDSAVYTKLQWLAHYGVTAVRVWTECYWMFPNAYTPYSISRDKANLDSWDSTYWTRVKNYVQRAKDLGIIVEIVLFSAYPADRVGSKSWLNTTVYNKDNNSNGIYTKNRKGHFWPQFYILNTTESGKNLTTHQTALIDKYIAEVGSYGNVIFSVANEYPGYTNKYDGSASMAAYPWMQYMAKYLKSKGAIVHVHANEFDGMNTRGINYFKDQSYIDILNFHFYATGLDNINAISNFLQPLQLSGKVLMCDESIEFSADTDTATREAWGSFVSGAYYLYYDSASNIGTRSWKSRIERARTMTNIVNSLPWYNMTSVNASGKKYDYLIRTAPAKYWQVLANPGANYVAFMSSQTSAANTTINLPAGSYNYKFYDTRVWHPNGISSGRVISTGGEVNIPSPSVVSWNSSSGLVLKITLEQ